MRLDGIPEPHTIVIQLPRLIVTRLTKQYMATGLDVTEATDAATRSMERRILQYLPAGAPYVIIDENRDYYPGIPIGALYHPQTSHRIAPPGEPQ